MAAMAASTAVVQAEPEFVEDTPEQKAKKEMNRREFLTYAWGAALGLLVLESGVAMYFFMLPRFKAGEFGGKFFVPTSSIPPTDAAPVPYTDGKFWLVQTQEERAAGPLHGVHPPGLPLQVGRIQQSLRMSLSRVQVHTRRLLYRRAGAALVGHFPDHRRGRGVGRRHRQEDHGDTSGTLAGPGSACLITVRARAESVFTTVIFGFSDPMN